MRNNGDWILLDEAEPKENRPYVTLDVKGERDFLPWDDGCFIDSQGDCWPDVIAWREATDEEIERWHNGVFEFEE